MISVITPVHGASELSTQYARAVHGCEVIIVDNASTPDAADVWERAAKHLEGHYIRNDVNRWYATACNQGYQKATGDVVVFSNNDIMAREDEPFKRLEGIAPGALYGPAIGMRTLSGQPLIYIDAWWIAARRETWDALKWYEEGRHLGPWDGTAFQGMYWDDVDLCFRAARLGISLRTVSLPLAHLSNYTSSRTPGAYAKTDSNGGDGTHKAVCEARVRAWQEAQR